MPTKADFEAAAEKLRTAAQQVGDLTAAAEGAGASDILRGGSLGRQVPERISAAAVSAQSCKSSILDVEAICLERAGLIADYEQQLAVYDVAYSRYQSQMYQYWRDYDSWYYSGGEMPHPGSPPWAPPKPTPPPSWADVRLP